MVAIRELLQQRDDLSTFVVHFTRDSVNADAYDNLVSILQTGCIEARNPWGYARYQVLGTLADSQKAVCFTETPLTHARMMCSDIDERRDMRFNGYGLAFSKRYARQQGVNPVWYVDSSTRPTGVFRDFLTNPITKLINDAMPTDPMKTTDEILAEFPIFRLTPFIETMGTTVKGTPKEFWWEREWRHVGCVNFMPSEVKAVLASEQDHTKLRTTLTGIPGYAATRFVDVRWTAGRINEALDGVDIDPFPL